MGDERASGGVEGGVAGCSQSAIMLVPDNAYLFFPVGIVLHHSLQNFDAFVGGAIVHKDVLQVLVGLLKQAPRTSLDVFLHPVNGNQYANLIHIFSVKSLENTVAQLYTIILHSVFTSAKVQIFLACCTSFKSSNSQYLACSIDAV